MKNRLTWWRPTTDQADYERAQSKEAHRSARRTRTARDADRAGQRWEEADRRRERGGRR